MSAKIIWEAAALAVIATGAPAAGKDADALLRQKAETICASDAVALCPDAIGNDQQIAACLRASREKLSPPCRKAYDAAERSAR